MCMKVSDCLSRAGRTNLKKVSAFGPFSVLYRVNDRIALLKEENTLECYKSLLCH